MSRTITYNIDSVELYTSPVESFERVVKSCNFIAEIVEEIDNGDGTVSTFRTSNGGRAEFNPPDPAQFLPYEQITKEILLDWIWTKVDKVDFENRLNMRLDAVKTPPPTVTIPFN